ncbi:SDR family NAD(P)-dependent oxidoreductase [Micromonospora aurantiaca]|uniref:SDR family NAD(P)-dependent oxidoreductase n=1 Tax=Micromonospora aurantiaca (nom. illeg.) TaxID=47850 RepID=UPI0034530B8B
MITGAGRGIGAHLALWYLRRGATVLAGRRSLDAESILDRCDDGPGRRRDVALDVADPESVRRAFESTTDFADIDVLINNAGVYNADGTPHRPGESRQSLSNISAADALEVLRTNTVAPLVIAATWRGRLTGTRRTGGPLLVNVSSRFGSLAERVDGGDYYYAASKAALNMVTRCLASDLGPTVTVVSVHPGWVRTGVGGSGAPLAPEDAVETLGALFARLRPSDTGTFVDQSGNEIPW